MFRHKYQFVSAWSTDLIAVRGSAPNNHREVACVPIAEREVTHMSA